MQWKVPGKPPVNGREPGMWRHLGGERREGRGGEEQGGEGRGWEGRGCDGKGWEEGGDDETQEGLKKNHDKFPARC